ncbi:hypothetical protein MMC26_004215 [Xylographa opegraphella]|nr:hypothetical protein [Xylographa opegraphella]
MSLKNVIILGAGGNLGPSILAALTSDPHFTVSVLSRHSSTSTFPPGVTVHRIGDDYPEADLLAAFKGQDAVVSTLSHAVGHKAIIDAAIKAGVKRFVPSEFGSNTRNANVLALMPKLFGPKVEVVDYLKEKEATGLTWSAVVTGAFFDWALKVGFLGFDIPAREATIFDDGATRWATTTLAQIGRAVRNTLLVPEQSANRYLPVSSFTVSQNSVLAALEEATGQKWAVTRVDAEAVKRAALARLEKGEFDMGVVTDLIRYLHFVDGYGSNYAEEGLGCNELLSLETESLEETVARVVKG